VDMEEEKPACKTVHAVGATAREPKEGRTRCTPHSAPAMRRLETRGKRREKQQTAGSRANSSLLLSNAAIREAAAEEVTGGRWFYIPCTRQ